VRGQVLHRVRRKAEMYGQDLDDLSIGGDDRVEVGQRPCHYKVDPQLIADLYERWVMPLTKEVQIAYLLRRLDG
jgi:chorismate mutase